MLHVVQNSKMLCSKMFWSTWLLALSEPQHTDPQHCERNETMNLKENFNYIFKTQNWSVKKISIYRIT